MTPSLLRLLFLGSLFLSLTGLLCAQKAAPHEVTFKKWDIDQSKSLSKSELPEKMHPDFGWADLDDSGSLSKFEYQRYVITSRRLTKSLKTMPEDTKTIKNLPYVENGHVRQKLDLYLPPNTDQSAAKLPLVLWVHGGGWKNGNKESLVGQACLLKAGFAIASANYRLSRTHAFPAQIHDCKAAVRYLRKHAAQHNIDPDRIGIWGSSAGGHLVSLLGTTTGNDKLEGALGNPETSSAVQAVCSYFGPADLFLQAAQKGKPNKETPAETIGIFLGGPFDQKHDLARLASPLFHVTKDAPPFLLIHGDADPIVPVSQSTIFHKKLKETGVDSTLQIVPGGIHGFFKEPAQLDLVTRFFQRTLKHQKIAP